MEYLLILTDHRPFAIHLFKLQSIWRTSVIEAAVNGFAPEGEPPRSAQMPGRVAERVKVLPVVVQEVFTSITLIAERVGCPAAGGLVKIPVALGGGDMVGVGVNEHDGEPTARDC